MSYRALVKTSISDVKNEETVVTVTINIRQMLEMCSQSKRGPTIHHGVYFDAIKLALDFMVYLKMGFS